ncbi:MAG: DUF2252 domain-containing protein [Acidobacteria bacterium]|nr:DUF2252 domain-containing protein [Acidobacteriota bacterium]
MKANHTIERIRRFNAGRDQQLLKLKYQAMRADVFTFFRGACHLFYEDWPQQSSLNDAPPVWSCGDLHLENFGSYKGDNRLIYFDINDFDEAALAPCTWDVTRMLTSVLLAATTLKLSAHDGLALCASYLDAYARALTKGQARWVEKETATGLVKQLLLALVTRRRQDFLAERTEIKQQQRRFVMDGKRALPVSTPARQRIKTLLKAWAATQPEPGFFKLLDVAQRIAGTGSLGVERYVLLVEGKGSPAGNYLLDFKAEPGSCLAPFLPLAQPKWPNEAARVVAVQEHFQATPPALLSALRFEDKSFVLRELQPLQDRVRLNARNARLKPLTELLATMGALTAWDQLRASGRLGAAPADDLMAFAKQRQWRNAVLKHARAYARQTAEDYRCFAQATDDQLSR